jgi:polar amino acid transport system substrate-binding protein
VKRVVPLPVSLAVLLTVACATSLIATPASAGAGARDELGDVTQLRWGGDLQGGEPYVYEDPKEPGKIRGFEVEIAEALARELGVRPRFVQTDWSTLVPALERGDLDVILNGLEDTPERRARIALSVPYFVYGETLTVRRGAPYRTLDDLAGRRVGTLNQTVAHDLLEQRKLEIVLYEGQQEPYFDLVKGRTDAVLLDHVIADRYGCPLKELECRTEDIARGYYVAGVLRGKPALLAGIDGGFRKLAASGELRRILEHYGLWDARQLELIPAPAAAPSATPSPSTSAPAPAPSAVVPAAAEDTPRFRAGHARLLLEGAAVTLALSISSFLIACPLGLLLAILRLHAGRAARYASAAYVEVFRGTPLLLQLYVLYFGIADLVRLNPMTAAILGLGLNYAAYEAEVHRGALLSLPRGQTEAARALGLGRLQTLRHVLLPQSLRSALPALTNDFVALLKDSSLVSVITVVELTKRMTILSVELRDWVLPGVLCAAIYFVLGFPLSRLSRRLERSLHHDREVRLA